MTAPLRYRWLWTRDLPCGRVNAMRRRHLLDSILGDILFAVLVTAAVAAAVGAFGRMLAVPE